VEVSWCSGDGVGLGRVDVLGEVRLGDLDEGVERGGVVDGQIREDLAVDLDLGGLEALDEAVVYVMPCARTAALMRWIQRRRKSPFLALRSL